MNRFVVLHEKILCLVSGKQRIPITSPWDVRERPLALDRLHGGGFVFVLAGVSPQTGRSFLVFANMLDLQELLRLEVDTHGHVVAHAAVPVAALAEERLEAQAVNDPGVIARHLQQKNNDYAVYLFLYDLLGRDAAKSVLDGYAGAIPRQRPEAAVRLVILFNHNYARNLEKLYALYKNKFDGIDFILPCAAPEHPYCFAASFGSYQFHGMLAAYFEAQLRQERSRLPQAYVVIQDDVLLHPDVTQQTYREKLGLDVSPLSFGTMQPYTPERPWDWVPRIELTLRAQDSKVGGNGFEGLGPYGSPQRLYSGFSDYVALDASQLEPFCHYMRPLVATNLFPEVAIPTVLATLAQRAGVAISQVSGRPLWLEDRKQTREKDYIVEFLQSNDVFLHPFKLAQLPPGFYDLVAGTPGAAAPVAVHEA